MKPNQENKSIDEIKGFVVSTQQHVYENHGVELDLQAIKNMASYLAQDKISEEIKNRLKDWSPNSLFTLEHVCAELEDKRPKRKKKSS